jgi:predicted transcriptional regulator
VLAELSQAALAAVAVVPAALIAEYEAGIGIPRASDLQAIKAALERAGVEFIDGDRPGVRLRKE